MCRWLSYVGDPVYLEKLVFEPHHSLVEQSLHAEQAKTPTNGDGFGIGWYDERPGCTAKPFRRGTTRIYDPLPIIFDPGCSLPMFAHRPAPTPAGPIAIRSPTIITCSCIMARSAITRWCADRLKA